MRIHFTLLPLWALACASAPTPMPASPASPFQPRSFTVKVSGAGRPIVFIPGLACDGSVWKATVAHLAGKFQAHVITLSGFAGSAPLDDQPLLPTARTELIEYLRRNHLDRPILVGHSLGGFLAYWISETAPALVGGVIAVDGAPNLGTLVDPTATSEVIRARAEAFAKPMATMPPEQFGTAIQRFLGQSVASPSDAARIGAAASRSDPRTVSNAMASWRAQVDAIPRHEIVFIEHSKHFVMLDQPSAFQQALDRFLVDK